MLIELRRSCVLRKEAHHVHFLGARNFETRKHANPASKKHGPEAIEMLDAVVISDPDDLDAVALACSEKGRVVGGLISRRLDAPIRSSIGKRIDLQGCSEESGTRRAFECLIEKGFRHWSHDEFGAAFGEPSPPWFPIGHDPLDRAPEIRGMVRLA